MTDCKHTMFPKVAGQRPLSDGSGHDLEVPRVSTACGHDGL